MRWLIAMYILTNGSNCPHIFGTCLTWGHIEKSVQPAIEILVPAKKGNQSRDILLNGPGLGPGV